MITIYIHKLKKDQGIFCLNMRGNVSFLGVCAFPQVEYINLDTF